MKAPPEDTTLPAGEPSRITTVTGSSHGAAPAPPVNVGFDVVSTAPSSGEATVTTGVVCTVNVTELLVTVPHSELVCSTTAVYCPSSSGDPGVISHVSPHGSSCLGANTVDDCVGEPPVPVPLKMLSVMGSN